jgi:hypothetical protein
MLRRVLPFPRTFGRKSPRSAAEHIALIGDWGQPDLMQHVPIIPQRSVPADAGVALRLPGDFVA